MKIISALNEKMTLNSVIVALSLDFDEAFFLYHNSDSYAKTIRNVQAVFKRNRPMEVHFIELKDDQHQIEVLFETYEDLVVDISGNKYISLLLFEKALKEKRRIVYYDSTENSIKTYRKHLLLSEQAFKLTIEDMMLLGGGSIKRNLHGLPDLKNTALCNSICAAVENTSRRYNEFTTFVQKFAKVLNHPLGQSEYRLDGGLQHDIDNDGMLKICLEAGLFSIRDDIVTFSDPWIAHLFEVSGSFLESYLYIKLSKSKRFDEVMMSTVVDFSGPTTRNQQIICELDGLVMKDNHLVFISCKSNKVDTYAINEIKLHSLMFGNTLAHACVCTLDDINIKSPGVYAKAQELGVAIIDRTGFKNKRVVDLIGSIIDGTYQYEELAQ